MRAARAGRSRGRRGGPSRPWPRPSPRPRPRPALLAGGEAAGVEGVQRFRRGVMAPHSTCFCTSPERGVGRPLTLETAASKRVKDSPELDALPRTERAWRESRPWMGPHPPCEALEAADTGVHGLNTTPPHTHTQSLSQPGWMKLPLSSNQAKTLAARFWGSWRDARHSSTTFSSGRPVPTVTPEAGVRQNRLRQPHGAELYLDLRSAQKRSNTPTHIITEAQNAP